MSYNYKRGARLLLGSLALGALTFVSRPSVSQTVSHTLSFQGVVTAANGKAVDGDRSVVVRLYSDASGEHEVWRDTYDAHIVNGVFSIDLGSGKALPSAEVMGQQLWAGIQIDRDTEMRPLAPLSSSPFALSIADKSVTKEKMATDYVSSISVNGQKLSGVGKDVSIETGDGIQASVDPTTNSLMLKSGMKSIDGAKGGAVEGNTTISGSLTVSGTSFLGSGSSTPTYIRGTADVSGDIVMTAGHTIQLPALTASRVVRTDASSNLTTGTVDLANDNDITGDLPPAHLDGGTNAGTTTFWRGDGAWNTAVTSVASGDLSPLFTTSVSNSATTPSISYTLSNAAAHTFYGNFSASSTTPSFGSPTLASADFANQGTTTTVLHGNVSGNPSWSAVNLANDVTGNLAVSHLNSGTGAGSTTFWRGDGAWGTAVTSIGLSTTGMGLTISNSPITTSGTIALGGTLNVAHGGTGATTQQAAINALTGSQSYGSYLRSDGTDATLSVLQASDMTGTISVSHGGTGASTLATGGILHAHGTSAVTSSAVGLASSDVSGTLPIGNGGTGTSSAPTQYGVVYASSTTGYASTSAGTSGQVLTSNGTSAPTWQDVPGLPSGAIVLFADRDSHSGYSYTGKGFVVTSDAWRTKSSMANRRNGHAAAAPGNGKLYTIGGDFGGATATCEEYDPSSDAWTSKASMHIARRFLAAAAPGNGKLYAVGGDAVIGGNESYLSTCEEYNPSTNTWTTKASMATSRNNLAAAAPGNGKLYVVGGYDGTSVVTTCEEYDPSSNTWTAKSPMNTSRTLLAAAAPWQW